VLWACETPVSTTARTSPGAGQSQRHQLDVARAGVDEHRVLAAAVEDGGLVEDTGRRSGDVVLPALAGRGQRRGVQAQAPEVVESDEQGALDGGRRGQARSRRDVGDEGGLEAAPPVAGDSSAQQAPQGAQGIGGPAGHLARADLVQAQADGLVELVGGDDDEVVGAFADGNDGGLADGERQGQS
jgi:hypothetical protein